MKRRRRIVFTNTGAGNGSLHRQLLWRLLPGCAVSVRRRLFCNPGESHDRSPLSEARPILA